MTSRGTAPAFVTSDLANALVLLGYGLTWSGARVFDGRKIRPMLVLLAPAIWLLLCRIPAFADTCRRIVVRFDHAGAVGAAHGARSFGAAATSR